jgi:hypothetical protein
VSVVVMWVMGVAARSVSKKPAVDSVGRGSLVTGGSCGACVHVSQTGRAREAMSIKVTGAGTAVLGCLRDRRCQQLENPTKQPIIKLVQRARSAAAGGIIAGRSNIDTRQVSDQVNGKKDTANDQCGTCIHPLSTVAGNR